MVATLHYSVLERLQAIIPGGVNSPVRAFKGLGLPPMVVEKGVGDTLYDIEGYKFIDYCCSWGPLILGHKRASCVRAIQEQLERGWTFGITTALEAELAEMIVAATKRDLQLRFVSTGTEATMTALRVARGYTHRPYIIKFAGNYHGHSDSLLVQAGSGLLYTTPTPSSGGVLDDFVKYTLVAPYNDEGAVDAIFNDERYRGQIAAVIVEPISANMGVVPPSPSFLPKLREITKREGALLIFDEVITGFRVSYGGAAELYGIDPDLYCYGKIIGGGLPAAAFAAPKEIMSLLAPIGPVYQAGTLSGCPLAMAAGLATLRELQREGVYEILKEKADKIVHPVKRFIESQGLNACVNQVGSLFTLFFGQKSVTSLEDVSKLNAEVFADFFRHLYAAGIYAPPSQYESWFVSLVHTDDHLEHTKNVILDFLKNYY